MKTSAHRGFVLPHSNIGLLTRFEHKQLHTTETSSIIYKDILRLFDLITSNMNISFAAIVNDCRYGSIKPIRTQKANVKKHKMTRKRQHEESEFKCRCYK